MTKIIHKYPDSIEYSDVVAFADWMLEECEWNDTDMLQRFYEEPWKWSEEIEALANGDEERVKRLVNESYYFPVDCDNCGYANAEDAEECGDCGEALPEITFDDVKREIAFPTGAAQ